MVCGQSAEARLFLEFDSKEAAEAFAKEISAYTTANVHYYVREKEPEPGAVRKQGSTDGGPEGKK